MSQQKVWFITGASRGFGNIWTKAALKRGDKVAASARDLRTLNTLKGPYGDELLPIELDVTNRDAVFAAVQKAHAHFGRLDVVLSNAGYGVFGALEEVSPAEVHAAFETNFFGTLSLIQAALPLLRAQKSGHIISVSSLSGLIALPLFGVYQATKFALEGLIETLAQEVAGFGIKTTLLEPGPYATEFTMVAKQATPQPQYSALRDALMALMETEEVGNPVATADALFAVVDAAQPPLRLMMGTTVLPHVRRVYAERLESWQQWESVATAAHG